MKKYIVYRKQVCRIVSEEEGMYKLEPIYDESIKYQIPVNSPVLRDLITKEEIEHLLECIPSIDIIDNSEKMIENTYKELMSSGTHADLIKVIKTTYLRNEIRKQKNKKTSDKDTEYLNRAEKYLYGELSVVLGMNFEETKEYVINKVNKKHKK